MTHPTLRALARLTTTLAAAATLSACEPEDDKTPPRQNTAPDQGQDMPVEQDMAPDAAIDEDQAQDMPVGEDMGPDMAAPSLDDLIPADAPKVSKLAGIQRADDVWHLDATTIIARQRPTQGAAPSPNLLVLEETAHTFAAFKLTDGVATPLGAPVKLELEADGAVARDGDKLRVAVRGAAGATEIIPLAVDAGALAPSAPLATIPADIDVESLASYSGVLYAVGTRVDADGKRRRELHNLESKAALGDDRLDALTHVGIVPLAEGMVAPGAAPVLMGRDAEGDVIAVVVDDAQTMMFFGELHSSDGAAPHEPDAALIIVDDKKYLGFAVDTRGGVKVETGELILARIVATLTPAVSFEQGGVSRGALPGGVFGGAEVKASGARYLPAFGKVRRIASHTTSQGFERAAQPGAISVAMVTLPADGDKGAFKALPIQGGAGAVATQLIERADGTVEVTEVSGDRLATYTYDPARELSFAADGRIKAGAAPLLGVAATGRGAARLVVAAQRGPLTLEEGAQAGVLTLREGIFGAVLGINTTKKEPPVLVQGKAVSFENPVFAPIAGGLNNVLARVSATGGNGAPQAGFFVAEAEVLRGLKEGEALEAGNNSGVTLLPPGFVVAQFIGHGEDVYFLGAKDAGGFFKDGISNASLFHVTVKAKAKGDLAAPTEIMSAAKLRADVGDETAEFASLKLGDADLATPVPGLVALVRGGAQRSPRLHKPLIITKELDKSTPPLRVDLGGGSGVSISGGDIIFQDNSAFLLVFSDGSVNKPALITFTAEGVKLEARALVGVSPELGALLADEDQVDDAAPYIELDSDSDGIPDVWFITIRSAGANGRPYNLALRHRGDGYTPILSPDALIYGALPLAPAGAREARALPDALATTLQR